MYNARKPTALTQAKVLRVTRFDASKCGTLIDSLHFYHYEYDEEQRIFSREPHHMTGLRMRATQ